jgi:hypothetical protein
MSSLCLDHLSTFKNLDLEGFYQGAKNMSSQIYIQHSETPCLPQHPRIAQQLLEFHLMHHHVMCQGILLNGVAAHLQTTWQMLRWHKPAQDSGEAHVILNPKILGK